MSRTLLYAGLGLGGAALAYFAYKAMSTPTQAYAPTSLNPNSNPTYFTTDNFQSYPFTANQPPRVDNSNQPWANNNRGAIAQVSPPGVDVNLSNFAMAADFAKNAADISSSLTSLWDTFDVASWFNGADTSDIMSDMDFTGDFGTTGFDFGSIA